MSIHIYVALPAGAPTAVAERVFEEVCVLWLPESTPLCMGETQSAVMLYPDLDSFWDALRKYAVSGFLAPSLELYAGKPVVPR